MKLVILYNLGGFEVFLKVPVIIIVRFGENNVLGPICIYRSISINFGCTWLTLQFSFTLHIKGKITRTWLILKSNSTLFWPRNFFPTVNNKKLQLTGGPSTIFLASIVVLIDIKAMLLTPGICSSVLNDICPPEKSQLLN